jgi:hypothetical protein
VEEAESFDMEGCCSTFDIIITASIAVFFVLCVCVYNIDRYIACMYMVGLFIPSNHQLSICSK